MKKSDPIHPGETLLEDFIKPHNLSATKLAKILPKKRGRKKRGRATLSI